MNEECPNCRQLTNTSFSRLVKDTCGHTKCRMCLLYEEQGCKTCNNEHRIQNIGNYDCSPSKKESGNSSDNIETTTNNEEIVLPLELVINKVSKPKDNHFEVVSVDCVTQAESKQNDTIFNNKTEVYESSTNGDTSNKLYIPKIEPCDVVLNIRNHLNDTTNAILQSESTYNERISNVSNTKAKTDFPSKEKFVNSKPLKYPDRTHISIISGTPERYKCNVCGKIFRNKKGKCYHDACITGIRPYQCTFCDRSFVKRSHFEYHERVHSGYKPFKCNLCEKAFPQQNKLNRHMYSHSKEKQFSCPKCNKAYTKRDDLKNHLNIHNGTATYSCKSCEKSFRILTNLKRHMRTHTNERPHVCDQCNKSFKDKSLLLRHKRTHGKERPFSCAHCNRVFLSKSELRRHLTVHSDEKPFSCEYCQTVFRRKDNLNRHIRHHHLEDSSIDANKLPNNIEDTSTKLGKTKQINPKQKQKPKKTQRITSSTLPKSPNKVSVVHLSSRDQISSRLDSMGNITPVIRTTSEVSNAVPVINGPISIKRPEDKTDTRKKTFTYTEPIPLAEAVVINRRIEEKLYPQTVSNHNYFFRNCLTCTDKQYPSLSQTSRTSFNAKISMSKTIPCDNSDSELMSSSQTNFACQNIEHESKNDNEHLADSSNSNYSTETVSVDESSYTKSDQNNHLLASAKSGQTNCVSTIKKHTVQQFESDILKECSSSNTQFETAKSTPSSRKIENTNEKKQSNVHWRRRMADILKPSNQ